MAITKKEFIAQHFPEYKDIDPRFDSRFVYKVARALYEAKFYKRWHSAIELAVQNTLLKMQGKYEYKKFVRTKVEDLNKP